MESSQRREELNIETFGSDAGASETNCRRAGRDDFIFLLETLLQVPDLSLQGHNLLAQLDDLVVLGGDLLVDRAGCPIAFRVT